MNVGEDPPPPPVMMKMAEQPPGGACHNDPASVPMKLYREAPTGSAFTGVIVAVGVGVPDGVAPKDSDPVGLGVDVGEGEHMVRKKLCVGADVSLYDAIVLDAPSSTRSVWLMARVLQEPAMPAAVHAAGGVQHVVVTGARWVNITEDTGDAASPRSTIQNSFTVCPPEL